MERTGLMSAGVILLVLGALWVVALQYRTLTEPDEGRYAEIPREMLSSGDWVVPHLNGVPYLEKPPLQYWATAAAYRVFGVSPWVARAWTAALGLLGIAVVFLLGRSLYGLDAGRRGALVLASCPLYIFMSQINVLDMGLAFFLTAAMACFLHAQRLSPEDSGSRTWMRWCWLALSLGFLQKGLVSFALPAIALLAYSIIQRDLAWAKRMRWTDGAIIAAVIDGPWVALMCQRNSSFASFFFIHEHFARFTSTVHDRVQPWWFFLVVVTVGAMPWLPAIVTGTIDAWRTSRRSDEFQIERFLCIWAAAILVFFSLSGSKLIPYVVPMLAPLALLAGRNMTITADRRHMSGNLASTAVLALLLVWLPVAVAHFMPAGPKTETYAQVGEWMTLSGIIILGTVLIVIMMMRIKRQALITAMVIAALGINAGLITLSAATNDLEPLEGGPSVSQSIAPLLQADTPFYCVGMYPQTVTFTLSRTCVLVAYKGELIHASTEGDKQWIPTIESFAMRWKDQPDAVAIVDKRIFPRLVDAQLPMQIVDQTNTLLVIRHRIVIAMAR